MTVVTGQQQRLHWVLDYGGHLIGGLLLAYGGWLWMFDGGRRERDFGLKLMLCSIGIWSASRLILYILSGHIPFVTKQNKVLEIIKRPWVLAFCFWAVVCGGLTWVLGEALRAGVTHDHRAQRQEDQKYVAHLPTREFDVDPGLYAFPSKNLGVMIQLDAGKVVSASNFAEMQQKYPNILAGYRPMIKEENLFGIVYSLCISAKDKATADKLCADLKSEGWPECIVAQCGYLPAN